MCLGLLVKQEMQLKFKPGFSFCSCYEDPFYMVQSIPVVKSQLFKGQFGIFYQQNRTRGIFSVLFVRNNCCSCATLENIRQF